MHACMPACLRALRACLPAFPGLARTWGSRSMSSGSSCSGNTLHKNDTVRRRAPTTMQVRMAPKMGIADFITADATFDQLAAMEDDEERLISAEILKRWQFMRVVHACTRANAQ